MDPIATLGSQDPAGVAEECPHFHLHVSGTDAILEGPSGAPTVAEDELPDPRGALEAFARAARRAPDEPDYHYILGQALVEGGRLVEAIASLREAVRLQPAEPTYQMSLGSALWRAARFDPALAAFDEASRLRPDDATVWSALGAASVAVGRPAEARQAIETALRLEPKLASALSNRGVALWHRRQVEAALDSFLAATRAAPEAAYAHTNLGLALLARDRPKDALESLEKARQLQPRSAAVLADLGDALYRLGRMSEAEDAFGQAVEISPTCLELRPASRDAFLQLTRASLRKEMQIARSRPALVTRILTVAMGLIDGARRLRIRRGRLAYTLAILIGLLAGYTALRLLPPFIRYYQFKDDLGSVASAPTRDETHVRERLMHFVHMRHLEAHVQETSCQIDTRKDWRVVTCNYSVPVVFVPGLARSLRFEAVVERPFVDLDDLRRALRGSTGLVESE
jgi:Flp pilus assembly protein TadD